jgi:hypothetical protein
MIWQTSFSLHDAFLNHSHRLLQQWLISFVILRY